MAVRFVCLFVFFGTRCSLCYYQTKHTNGIWSPHFIPLALSKFESVITINFIHNIMTEILTKMVADNSFSRLYSKFKYFGSKIIDLLWHNIHCMPIHLLNRI